MKYFSLVLPFLLIGVSTTVAAESYPTSTSVSTDMGECCGSPVSNLTNGSGLLDGYNPSSRHDTSGIWLSTTKTGTVTFNFTLPQGNLLTGVSVWNTAFGVSGFNLQGSTDGTNYQSILGPTSLSNVASGTTTGERFSFTPVAASFVRMNITSGHSVGSTTGLKEVMFIADVPEPATAGLAIVAVAGLLLRRQRLSVRI